MVTPEDGEETAGRTGVRQPAASSPSQQAYEGIRLIHRWTTR